MDELFRFAISRAPDKTAAPTLPLHRLTNLQDQLHELVMTQHPYAEWNRILPAAEGYLRNNIDLLNAVNDRTGQSVDSALMNSLRTFASGLQSVLGTTNTVPGPVTTAGRQRVSVLHESLRVPIRPLLPAGPAMDDLATRLCDIFLALMIFRTHGPLGIDRLLRPRPIPDANLALATLLQQDRPSLEEIAGLLRLMDIAQRLLADPHAFPTEASLRSALRVTLMLPPRIFAYFRRPVQPVGITDLLVVKQHILRYEMGEIARIENILKGETRSHNQKHTLSNERESLFETDKTTETEEELTTRDHLSIRNETENILKEDFSVNTGVHAQYDGGAFKIQADVTVAYDRSSTDSRKFASEMAKDVTQRAAKKVSERVRQSTRTRVVETFEESELQEFKNRSAANISGVYQWIDKVYLAQVFNYGKHLLFDVMVPEPAASLLSAATAVLPEQTPPVPPDPLTISPLDLSEDKNDLKFYSSYLAQYGVTGVQPPPPVYITLAKPLAVDNGDDNDANIAETLRIDDGYAALTADIAVAWFGDDNDHEDSKIDVSLGKIGVTFGKNPVFQREGFFKADDRNCTDFIKNRALDTGAIDPQPVEERSLAMTIKTQSITSFTTNIEVRCKRTDAHLAKWKLETYDRIAVRYQELRSAYEEALKAYRFQKKEEGVLANAPAELNRITERNELKRAAIGVLTKRQADIDGKNALIPWTQPFLPRFLDPHPDGADAIGSVVRFLEQAFEWDKISYVLYPYFWGRPEKWVERLQLKYESDPLFENFLRAGYARVVVPVRNNFEAAVNFFLMTGQPWLGGGLPNLGDSLYLPIIEEIKEQTGAPGDEKPVGDPWHIRIPTRLVKLRTGNEGKEFPSWTRTPARLNEEPPEGPWNWVVEK